MFILFRKCWVKKGSKYPLGSSETAVGASIFPSEFSTFGASPDYDLSTVWAWKLCSSTSRRDYSIA